jgi:hypothetical protein
MGVGGVFGAPDPSRGRGHGQMPGGFGHFGGGTVGGQTGDQGGGLDAYVLWHFINQDAC